LDSVSLMGLLPEMTITNGKTQTLGGYVVDYGEFLPEGKHKSRWSTTFPMDFEEVMPQKNSGSVIVL